YDAVLDGGSASVDLFRAECPEGRFFLGCALLTPDGRLVLAGGVAQDERDTELKEDNFVTTADVWVFRPEPLEEAGFPWGWVLGAILLPGAGSTLAYRYLHKRHPGTDNTLKANEADTRLRTDLITQMSSLIEDEKLFLRKDLRITDVATELATNKTYVSALLNNISGEKFTSLITRCRIEYAQRLMRERPDMLMDDVADESGFSSRTTFFRSFKALTGMTPQEWKNNA
ncbi:MAG: helix-turn-helix transcriptional regulator, partial [Bacteroidales bacterium]|nr:helix-turn-helix transcriptional regulator [Bacteroidales bacterium]